MRRKGHYALVYALRAPARWEAGLPGVAGVSRPAMPPPRRRDRGPRRAARRSGPGSPGGAGPALNATGPPGAKTSADDPGHVHVLGGGVDDDAKDHLLDSVGALETRALDGHARRWPRARWGGTSRRLRPKAPMAVRAAEAITTSVTTCFLSRCATSPAGLAGLRDKDAANVMQVGGPAYPGMRRQRT
jgi:hypothetical protein